MGPLSMFDVLQECQLKTLQQDLNCIVEDIAIMKARINNSIKALAYNFNIFTIFGSTSSSMAFLLVKRSDDPNGKPGLEKLAMNFKDLDDVEQSDLSLIDIKTGEIKQPHETRILVTPFSNTKIHKKTKEYTLYKFIDRGKIAEFAGHDVQGVQGKLSRTIKKKLDEKRE